MRSWRVRVAAAQPTVYRDHPRATRTSPSAVRRSQNELPLRPPTACEVSRLHRDRHPHPCARPLLGDSLWKNEFGGVPDIVGQTAKLNGRDTTIIGVMPEGWRFPEKADLWLPMQANTSAATHGFFHYHGHAMLKPGVTLDEARAE